MCVTGRGDVRLVDSIVEPLLEMGAEPYRQ